MWYRALGVVEVEDQAGTLALGGENQRRLLAVLLAHPGRAVTVETLAEALWGDGPPKSERQAVQTVVSRLRQALGDGRTDVQTVGDGYRLAADEANCDVVRFTSLVSQAADSPGSRASDLLGEALGLWQGPAFGSLAELEAVRMEALRLDEERLKVSEDRFQLMLELGRFEEAIPDLEALVAAEPLRERARAQLMQALYRTGRQADALGVYGRYRDLLGEDLGLEPSPQMRQLEEAILLDRVPRWAAPVAAGSVVAPPDDSIRGAEGDGARLEQEGWDALWERDHERSREVREAAYVLHLRRGDRPGAARVAIWLGVGAAIRMKTNVAFGWFGRAAALLEAQPVGPVHGVLTALTAMVEILGGHLEQGLAHAVAARRIGVDTSDPDVEALGTAFEGWALVRSGRPRAGMALVDQAMATAVAGGLSPYATGLVYCRTLCACTDLMDFQRATEWLDEIDRVRSSGGPSDLPGDCRTHRAAILVFRGEWGPAEAEARAACSETASFDMTHLGLGQVSLGEILLKRGEFEAARARFERAEELATSPLPGLALLDLMRGDADGAHAVIWGAVAEIEGDPLSRARLLPAAVDIALERGDIDKAASAAGELADIADMYGSSTLRAEAVEALGTVELARGEGAGARRHLRSAWRLWIDVGSPYRAAGARLRLAQALERGGRRDEAVVAARSAHGVFAEMGARPDARRSAELLTALGALGAGDASP